MPFNLTGHPAITLPCGFGGDGLPIGLQLVGRLRRESDLLAAAAVFEAARNVVSRWPDVEVQ
jgi:aspartyl-tRNA(Asn)/glutamyl-tRNA(Gln) amidotransferase subunit A